MKLNKYQTIIKSFAALLIAFVLASGTWYLYERNINKWELKTSEITVEYGESFEASIDELVDTKQYSDVTADNTTIEAGNIQYDDNNYMSVGEYDISVLHTIEYKLFGLTLFSVKDKKTVALSVADTVAPVFDVTSPTEIEFTKDCKEDITGKYKATDLSEVTITFDDANVDYSKVGEYTANVFATDKSDNITAYEVKVKIIEPTVELNLASLTLTADDSYTLEAKAKGKSQEIEWSSSDESIAKVENGKVTGNKAGTVTIKAKANGVEATCEVTVKAKVSPKTSSSSNNKNPSSGSSSKPSSSNSGNNKPSGSSGGSSNTKPSTTYYCDEGGSHHRRDAGQIGWYNTYNEALTALNAYMDKYGESHYTIAQCSCGKYTAYIH